MFEGRAVSDYPKLPTLIQFCRERKSEAEKYVKLVTLIWLPNQFESITLDTESFRLRINKSADFYSELLKQIAIWEEEEAVPFIRITNAQLFAYSLEVLPGEKATWEQVGDFGRRLQVKDKKASRKKRDSQNPSSLYGDRVQLTLPVGPQEAQEGA